MWNKHLQEETDKLDTTLKELPVPKRSSVLDNIKSRLAIVPLQPTKRTLTSHAHEWLLTQSDLQRVPIVTLPEQRVEQRVTPNLDTNAMPLQRITEAPPIMAAPNPTAKCTLKIMKRTHSQQTRNNIPGSVPKITRSPSGRWPLSAPTPPPIEAPQMPPTPRRSPRTHKWSNPQTTARIPKVHF
jgi:hypothetical protein